MVVDPLSKFKWITGHWEPQEAKEAREWIKESMLLYQQRSRSSHAQPAAVHAITQCNSLSRSLSAPQAALRSIRRGFSRLEDFDIDDTNPPPWSDSQTSGEARLHSAPPTALESNHETARRNAEEETALQLAEDKLIAEQELKAYEESSELPYHGDQVPDPLWFWEVNRHSYPLLFQVAMDVLPAQASAVSCERVFSSSKETCTLRRSHLSAPVLEALQILKYSFKQERLSFTSELLAKEVDYTIEGPLTSYAINELMKEGKYSELSELISNTVDSSTPCTTSQ